MRLRTRDSCPDTPAGADCGLPHLQAPVLGCGRPNTPTRLVSPPRTHVSESELGREPRSVSSCAAGLQVEYQLLNGGEAWLLAG